ncbi:methyl-accepting chemotaxis protein [Vibrio hannami]|uniref:methyl-accepting chemotaxis protein n=1 Tax=Vibrio hannami TaxID=2717094 RepID=UPI00240FD712|nr:methyl-accepting chemotaxis protein [Vibrio hannami]MDG3084954.1 methyl-accepting chemotaxis protein [Vibrio hannami]
MKKVSFKAKMYGLVISIITVTVLTSFLSANYFINNYISSSDTKTITNKVGMVKELLESTVTSGVQLAEASNFSLNEMKQTIEKTGFADIVKVTYGTVVTRDGILDPGSDAQAYLDIIGSYPGQTYVSDVYIENDKPMVYISVSEDDKAGNIFYADLSSVVQLLAESSGEGSYFELLDEKKTVVFSNKIDGDLMPISEAISFGGKEWLLTGYVDNGYIQSNTDSLNGSITIALLIAAAVIIPISIVLINLAFRPIVTLRELITDLASGSGDLTRRLKVETKDDLGQIALSINRFIENLQMMMKDVSGSSQSISSEIVQLEAQTGSNQDLLTAHRSEMEMAATSVTEMSATAESVAESASEAAKYTQSTSEQANISKQAVQGAMSSVNELMDEVDNMASSVIARKADVDEISSVLEVIGAIAEQTNLLALNAAIEAARAGEQGRGFAVVADEVRALASRTHTSTAEISSMLDKLKSGNDELVSRMDTTKNSCQQTVEITSQVMDSLDTVNTAVLEINDLTAQIATSAEEQSSVAEEINRNMNAIQGMIETLNSNGRASVESTLQLTDTNQQLVNIVGKFKI